MYRFVLSLIIAYISQCIHKIFPTLGNKKEQWQNSEKSSGELIFSRATKNLKIIYFTQKANLAQKKVTPLKNMTSKIF